MDQDSNAIVLSEIASLGRKSWTAYMRVVLVGIVLLLFVTPLVWSASVTAGVLALNASFALVLYQFLLLKSFRLYFDDVGVWCTQVFFPGIKALQV